MTQKEAIKILDGDFTGVTLKENESHSDLFAEAFNMAKEALDKQIPKKLQKRLCVTATRNVLVPFDIMIGNKCPCCGCTLMEGVYWCNGCGQAIDWSGE